MSSALTPGNGTGVASIANPSGKPRGATDNDLSPGRTPRRIRGFSVVGLLSPGVMVLTLGFILPLSWMLRMSFNRSGIGAQIENAWSFDTYSGALADGFVWGVIENTVRLGLSVTVATVVVSYPIALFLVRTKSRFKGLLLAMAIAPLLTSQVIRTYGWMIILGDQGIVNGTLQSMGFIDKPLALVNNQFGVVVALTEILMPYAILAMVAGFGRVSEDLEQAARSLGATSWKVFRRVTLPLTMPGVLVAALLVFVLTISSFVTPNLVGGGRVFVLATEIYYSASRTLNWPLAAALSMILIVLFGLLGSIHAALSRRLDS